MWTKNFIKTIFLTLTLLSSAQAAKNHHPTKVNKKRFYKPFCMIGNGKQNQSFKHKLKTLKRYQRKISRKTRDFRKNKKKENQATLHGSPKWVVIKYLRHRGYTWKEIDFAFLAMTLFAEARNLSKEDMAMVARVINNRREGRSYRDTTTELAQFSAWYYKNQWDNVTLLCPGKEFNKLWRKSVDVAYEYFDKEDTLLGSTHYFAPRNMVPRYRIPDWAKGRYAIGFGGHIFIVGKNDIDESLKKQLVFIGRKKKKAKVVRGRITILK
jgi:spore germination cell wall hydrolase CwlJ-like protein